MNSVTCKVRKMGTLIREGNGDLYESTIEHNCVVCTNDDILRRQGGEDTDNAPPQHLRKAANDLRNARRAVASRKAALATYRLKAAEFTWRALNADMDYFIWVLNVLRALYPL